MKKGFNIPYADGWQIVIARNLEEIEAIRPIWEQMQCNEPYPVPNADIDRYLSVVKTGGGGVQPFVMLVKHNGCPAAMIIGRIEKHRLNLKLGYKTLCKPALKCLSVVYGGVLGQPEGNLCSLLVGELMKQLRSREVDMVFFNHLREDSDFYKTVKDETSYFRIGWFPVTEPHWAISLTDTIDCLYQRFSPKNRNNLRRLVRRLERECNGQVGVITYTQKDEVEKAIDVMVGILARTYQSQFNLNGFDTDQTKDMLRLAAKRGWLRAYILLISGEPSAFELAIKYGHAYFGLYTGFDPKFRKYRIGTVLFLKFLESICGDPQARFFDFGFGDAHYKRLYADQCWQESSVYIFALRPYPAFINVLQSSIEALNLSLEYVVHKIGAVDLIKRRWRNLLQTKNLGSKHQVRR